MRAGFSVRTTFVGVAWFATLAAAVSHEFPRLMNAVDSPAGVFGWLFNMDSDWSLPVLVLLSLPFILLIVKIEKSKAATSCSIPMQPRSQTGSQQLQSVAAIAVFSLSLVSSAAIGFRSISLAPIPGRVNVPARVRFYELPPAYHDEFSYVLQARTFLAGRLSWPGMNVQPDLFHQVHVLNRPTTASRYFPWTGFWMAPFVAMGCPYFGHWLAGAIACVLFHRCLWRLMGLDWAVVGGVLMALSPGLASFSNLLLAHHPTLMVLAVFLWAFLRLMDKLRVRDAVVAGIALSLAMLSRPMTAAGFALPFGIWLLAAMIRHQCRRAKLPTSRIESAPLKWSPLRVLAGIGIPLLLGFCVLAIMNHAITGSWRKSAYQLYTETWTPRHRYGFHNTHVDPALPISKVLKAYDDWAEDLTFAKAQSNLVARTIYSLRWTLGISALTFCIIAALPACVNVKDKRPLFLLCSVLTLHAVHLPYWYDGIMHWHYVFETAPLLIMLATIGLSIAYKTLQSRLGTTVTTLWLTCVILASLTPNWIDAETFWGPSRITTAVREQTFSRVRFEYFQRLTTSEQIQHPALILVDERSSNPQLNYIVNPPDLSGDVIVCRLPDDPATIDELVHAFPGHHIYQFDPESFALNAL